MSNAKLPQRWDLVGEYDSYMSPIEEGDYVKVEDVEPLVAEIARLRAENNHLRRVNMGRPSAELHEAALEELHAEITRLRARVEVLERALRRIQATPHPSVAAQCTSCYSHQKTATYALEDAAS